jgi:hypothetical protein
MRHPDVRATRWMARAKVHPLRPASRLRPPRRRVRLSWRRDRSPKRRIPCFFRHARRLIGANHPPGEGLLGFARGFRSVHLGDGLRAVRERAQRTVRPAAPSEPVRSHKALSNSGRRCALGDTRSGAKLPAVR